MPYFTRLLVAALLMITTITGFSQTIAVRSFHKVIVSPYIEATFIQGDKEQVVINHAAVDPGKLHVASQNGTLRIYLEGEKCIPRNRRDGKKHRYDN